MTRKKHLTNDQIIRKLLTELQPLELVVLRERIGFVCDLTLKDTEKVKEGMRENGTAMFIHPDFFIKTVEKIKSIVDSNESDDLPVGSN